MSDTVSDLIGRLQTFPSGLPVIIHYDGHYEALGIMDVRLATKREQRHSVQAPGPHVVMEIET